MSLVKLRIHYRFMNIYEQIRVGNKFIIYLDIYIICIQSL